MTASERNDGTRSLGYLDGRGRFVGSVVTERYNPEPNELPEDPRDLIDMAFYTNVSALGECKRADNRKSGVTHQIERCPSSSTDLPRKVGPPRD
jgi:hypothetical protein